MLREYTCIIYPNGCGMGAQIGEREGGARRIRSVEGAACPKGGAYVEQEVIAHHRNTATSVLVRGGMLPLANVRLTNPTLRGRIFDAMNEIRKCILTAPMETGVVVIPHLLGYDADVIAAKPVPESGCR